MSARTLSTAILLLGLAAVPSTSAGQTETTPPPAESAQERRDLFESLTKNMGPGTTVELQALEIKARIYEPNVIYILDRAKLEVDLKEKEVHFSPRIFEVIEDDRL